VLISLEARIEAKKLAVEFYAQEDSMYVRADEDALHRVLYNLIENAIKFSHEGGALKVSIKENKSKELVLAVYNEGVGVSKEDLPNIFDRFYKSDKSRSQDKKGVGLGLYFVKTIVVAHGGDIKADSEEGKYCVFTVKLPKYQDK
jgi:signal transduction histidine kinase